MTAISHSPHNMLQLPITSRRMFSSRLEEFAKPFRTAMTVIFLFTISLFLTPASIVNAFAANVDTVQPKHAIAMYGDPAEPKGFSHLRYANPDAPQGGSITYGVVGSFDSLNPFILKSMRSTARGLWDPQFGHLYFQSLMQRSYDEPFTLYGLLAESVAIPEDRSWMEFTLNPDAKWHDGKPVIPEDVIFTYELLAEKGRPPFSTRMKRIESIEKTGDRKVRFTFNQDSNREFPLIVAGFTPVLPSHAIDRDNFDASTLEAVVGSGPYRIASIDAGKRIVYEKDPGYWGKVLPVARGLFNFDVVEIEYFRQETTLFEAFKKGIVDVYMEGDPAKWKRAYDFPAVTDGEIVKAEIESDAPPSMSGFVFNTRRPVFSNRDVRRALVSAFDFETLNKNLFFDAYERTESYWDGSELSSIGRPVSEMERDLLADFIDDVDTDKLSGEWHLPVTDGTGLDRAILRKVMKQLLASGMKRENGRLIQADGTPFSFEIMTRNAEEERIALAFKGTLDRFGISISIRSVDDAQYQKRLQTFDYDMVIARYSASLSPGIEQVWRWGSRSKDVEGSFNYSGVSDPAIDHLIEEMVASHERDRFIAAVRALDRVLLSGQYLIPLYHVPADWIAHRAYLDYPDAPPLYGNRFPVWWDKRAE
jgi:peptide/nickel transport system substrate-binding protein